MPHKVTIAKYGGNDTYSWAVFVDGKVVTDLTGLNRRQASYYKGMVEEQAKEAAAKKR